VPGYSLGQREVLPYDRRVAITMTVTLAPELTEAIEGSAGRQGLRSISDEYYAWTEAAGAHDRRPAVHQRSGGPAEALRGDWLQGRGHPLL